METSTAPEAQSAQRYSPLRVALAWGVHLYTATGIIAAALSAIFIIRGGEDSYRWAFLMTLLALVIDSSDGVLARKVEVKKVIPWFSGRRLDDLIDFHTYTSLPLLLLWRLEVVPDPYQWFLVLPLLASLYGFCQESIKTDDGYFLGFPSYWNVFVYYAYTLGWSWQTIVIIATILSILTFVPSRYMYPSQKGLLNRVTALLAIIWGVFCLYVFWRWFHEPISSPTMRFLNWVSVSFPIYYMIASWCLSIKLWMDKSSVGR